LASVRFECGRHCAPLMATDALCACVCEPSSKFQKAALLSDRGLLLFRQRIAASSPLGLNGFAEELAGEWNAIHQECLPLEVWSRLIGPFRLRNITPHKKAESGQECSGGGQKHAEANYQNLIYTNVPRMDSFNILTSSSIPYW
jgi:hypothetical protein